MNVATKQTRLKLRKGFVKAPLTYRILAINQLSKADMKVVAKTLIKVNAPSAAEDLVGVGSDWGFKIWASERVGVITYKGTEVAILFKRVTLMIEPLPEDPAPEGILENPEDVWIRYDLLGMSVRQQHKKVRSEMESQETEASLMQIELDAKDKIIASLEQQVKGQQTIIKKKIKEVIADPEVARHIRTTIVANENELKLAMRRRK